jgi:hypothetical protein
MEQRQRISLSSHVEAQRRYYRPSLQACIREDIVSFHLHAVRAGSETIDAMTVTVVRVVTQYDNPSSSSSSPNEHAAEGGQRQTSK